jgi:two-component system response regulator (stage 0 sporulation protein F)
MVLEVLTMLGYETDAAVSAIEALAMFDHKTYDLALIDFLMPEMNGDELARRLRQKAPGVKILMSTGFDDDPALARAQAEGVLVIQKPVGIERLHAAIDHLLSEGMPSQEFPEPSQPGARWAS